MRKTNVRNVRRTKKRNSIGEMCTSYKLALKSPYMDERVPITPSLGPREARTPERNSLGSSNSSNSYSSINNCSTSTAPTRSTVDYRQYPP